MKSSPWMRGGGGIETPRFKDEWKAVDNSDDNEDECSGVRRVFFGECLSEEADLFRVPLSEGDDTDSWVVLTKIETSLLKEIRSIF